MPVAALYVEGALDQRLLAAVLVARPAVEMVGGGKYGLPAAVRHRSSPIGGRRAYLRDRDFDDDPPADRVRPRIHRCDGRVILGWAWCRHEIENYLLEPELVVRALGCDPADYLAALKNAAATLVSYEACRWAAGVTRRSLPPAYQLTTRPADFDDRDFELPSDLAADAMRGWLVQHVGAFRARACPSLEPQVVLESMQHYQAKLELALNDAAEILAWFPGKDLMTALAPWLAQRDLQAHTCRNRLERWVREHPEQTLDILSEWRELAAALRNGD